jgi:hypothetical protein
VKNHVPKATNRRSGANRRDGTGPQRPRKCYDASPEHDGTQNADQLEFLKAMDLYKRNVNMFPSWTEVLEVLRDLGYRKVAEKRAE